MEHIRFLRPKREGEEEGRDGKHPATPPSAREYILAARKEKVHKIKAFRGGRGENKNRTGVLVSNITSSLR